MERIYGFGLLSVALKLVKRALVELGLNGAQLWIRPAWSGPKVAKKDTVLAWPHWSGALDYASLKWWDSSISGQWRASSIQDNDLQQRS